jgi:hypothetical protein
VPPAQADRTPSKPAAVAGTLVRERYLRAEKFLIGLIGVALLRLSAADGLSAADRTRLAGPLVEQLQAFLWQLDGVPFPQGWEVLDPPGRVRPLGPAAHHTPNAVRGQLGARGEELAGRAIPHTRRPCGSMNSTGMR